MSASQRIITTIFRSHPWVFPTGNTHHQECLNPAQQRGFWLLNAVKGSSQEHTSGEGGAGGACWPVHPELTASSTLSTPSTHELKAHGSLHSSCVALSGRTTVP